MRALEVVVLPALGVRAERYDPLLAALRDHGLSVPGDVGVLGLNDMEMSRWEGIDLTTIRQPIRQIVASTIELMVATLEEPDRYPEARVFPCRIVERRTLRPLPR